MKACTSHDGTTHSEATFECPGKWCGEDDAPHLQVPVLHYSSEPAEVYSSGLANIGDLLHPGLLAASLSAPVSPQVSALCKES